MTQPIVTGTTELIASWELALRAERKSPATIKVYRDGVQRYLTWCVATGAEPMDRTSLTLWIAGMLDAGKAPATARMRPLAVHRFVARQIVVGRLPADPFAGMKAPKVDEPVVDPLTDDQLRALIRACSGPDHGQVDERLHHLRDEAIICLMLETAIRAGEAVSLEIADVDLATRRQVGTNKAVTVVLNQVGILTATGRRSPQLSFLEGACTNVKSHLHSPLNVRRVLSVIATPER